MALIFLNVYIYQETINPIECPEILGQYAVKTNVSVKIKEKCGENANNICSFGNIQTLNDAINKCNALFETCESFTYSELSKTMNIVEKVDDGNEFVYIRQK